MRAGRLIATLLIALAVTAATPPASKSAKPKLAPLTPELRAAQALIDAPQVAG